MGRSYDLHGIRARREDILKAALFMFLHDVGKLQPGHQAKFIHGYKPPHYATRFSHYTHIHYHSYIKPIASWEVPLPDQTSVSLANIIRKHHGANEKNDGLWVVVSQRIDRLDSRWDRDNIISEGVQPIREFISITSPFGWVSWAYRRVEDSSNLECKHKSLPWPLYYAGPTQFSEQQNDCLDRLFRCLIQIVQISNRNSCLKALRKPYRITLRLITTKACGDTRFSVNDITLWDHSISTAILFKILASWSILTNPNLKNNRQFPRSNDERFTRWFHPQLLPLRIDGLAYLAQSNNIPDLLARRALLTQIYDALQDILEWEFPLAGEVYRDENGPVFLTFLRDKKGQNSIPLSALQLPTDSTDTHVLREAYLRALQTPKQSLEDYLRQAVVELSQGDLTLPPEIPLFTYTQKSTKAAGEKSLGDLLADEQKQGLWLQADGSNLQEAWEESQEVWNETKREEICSVCGLRPQGYGRWLVLNTDEARHEWIYHYQHNHRPNRPYREKTEEEKKCQVCKAISRKMCGVCLERRVDRAQTWAQGVHKPSQERFWNHPETVWLDEVADANGRLALIVGYFPLEHWLDGTLVESLAMFKRLSAASGATNRKVQVTDEKGKTHEVVLGPKPVSYSRIRRIWETTRRFWQDVAPTDAPPEELRDFCNSNGLNLETLWEGPPSLEESVAGKAIGEKRSRIFLKAANANELKDLGPFHAYEIVVQGRKVAVLWVPPEGKEKEVKDIPEEYRGGFWVIENLAYLERLFGKPFAQVLQEGAQYEIYEPSEYGRPGRAAARFTLAEQKTDAPGYTPLIPILAEPRTFMALVPADKALEVVRAIKTKYEREMGKVRNRLSLHLGVIYADAHMPLRVVLDAGRRMLAQKAQPLIWKVVCPARKMKDKGDTLPKRFEKDQEGQFKEWFEIVLETGDGERSRRITWYVPAVMGDGVTEDWWYPFAFLEAKEEPKDRNVYYKATNPGNKHHSWLVHVSKLRPGDVIYFTPATFDFIFLDHGGTRFEIAYDQSGRRRGTLRRPNLLDELDDLIECWEMLKQGLGARQIHQVRDLIETKRAEWFETPETSLKDATFEAFCRDVLANAEWKSGYEPDLKRLTHWAVTGLLADAVELFYHIMKQRPVGEEET